MMMIIKYFFVIVIAEFQSDMSHMEKDLHETTAIKRELESMDGDKSARVKSLEITNRLLKQEKDDLQKVIHRFRFETEIRLCGSPKFRLGFCSAVRTEKKSGFFSDGSKFSHRPSSHGHVTNT